MDAKDRLLEGVKVLEPVLAASDFTFVMQRNGPSSGGLFATGEDVRNDRRLELHFRSSLGLVTYHFAELSLNHRALMWLLADGKNEYPGFSDDPLDGFRHLRADLERYGADFLRGSDDELRRTMTEAHRVELTRPKGLAGLP